MDPLERQIAEAVNVDPSPEFVARVRARIAAEGTPAVRWRMSPFLAAGVTVATLLTALWVARNDRAVQTPLVAGVDVFLPAPVHARSATATDPPRVRAARLRPQPFARVIVASDEIRGLRRLSDLLRDGEALTFNDAQVSPVREIAVTPIDIAPLTVASIGEQGDEQ